MAGLVAMQAGIDAMVPQMSSTAHLAGAAIRFLAVLALGDRLRH
jgi:hypothetical protein